MGVVMVLRGVWHESEVLHRQVEARLLTLRARPGYPPGDLAQAEEIARHLRRLITDTARASAADRARVRAAVHYFVGLRVTRAPRRARSLADDVGVVRQMLLSLAPLANA